MRAAHKPGWWRFGRGLASTGVGGHSPPPLAGWWGRRRVMMFFSRAKMAVIFGICALGVLLSAVVVYVLAGGLWML